MDNTKYINTIEWFFGYGGNHLGLKRIFPNLRLIAACEIEAYPLAVMVDKMEKGLLDSAPIWTDCKTFPTEPFKGGWVDLFVASYPCQPFSAAGQRKGTDDERHLWPYVKKFIAETRPKICFFENVEGHVSLGLREVLTDLVDLGYRVANDYQEPTWGLFSAAEVGAPHQRKRVFILATLDDSAVRESIINSMLLGRAQGENNEFRQSSSLLAHNNPTSRHGEKRPERKPGNVFIGSGEELEHTRLLRQKKCKEQTTGIKQSSEELANTNNPRQREPGGGKPDEQEYPSAECGRWPARPGEEQYSWEKPRCT